MRVRVLVISSDCCCALPAHFHFGVLRMYGHNAIKQPTSPPPCRALFCHLLIYLVTYMVPEKGHEGNTAVVTAYIYIIYILYIILYICQEKYGIYISRGINSD